METMTSSKAETLQQKNIDTVKRFVQLVERRDIPAFLDLFAEEGMQYNYFQESMMPPVIKGKKALREFWIPIPDRFSSMKFPIEEIYPMADPQKVAVKYRGFAKLKDGSGEYNNEYFALFFFDEDGKIREYHEYSNPVVTAKAFKMMEKLFPY
jgi:ketosteroid isomerase-like protein